VEIGLIQRIPKPLKQQRDHGRGDGMSFSLHCSS